MGASVRDALSILLDGRNLGGSWAQCSPGSALRIGWGEAVEYARAG